MFLMPIDDGIKSHQAERIGRYKGRQRVQRNERFDRALTNLVRRFDRSSQRSIFDNPD